MAYTIVDTGEVTSWAGTGNSALVTSGSLPSEFTLSIEADEHKTTAMAPTVVYETSIPGIRNATATINVRLNPAQHGSTGLVTNSAGYTAGVRAWSMDLVAPALPTTAYNATSPTSNTYQPGLISWSGRYESFIDTGTSMVQPGATPGSATFKILENGANDQTLAGNIWIKKFDLRYKLGELAVVTADYMGTSTLTAAGTSGSGIGNPWFSAGAVAIPSTGSLVLTGSTGKTYTGSAFWERFSINHEVTGLVTATISVRFTGDITIA